MTIGRVSQAIVSFAPLWQAQEAVNLLDEKLLLEKYPLFVTNLKADPLCGEDKLLSILPDPRLVQTSTVREDLSTSSSRVIQKLCPSSHCLPTKVEIPESHHSPPPQQVSLQHSLQISPPAATRPIFAVKVTRIAKTVSEDTVSDLFQRHGKLVGKPKIHNSKNRYAWVNFDKLQSAEDAVRHLNNFCLDGWPITVKKGLTCSALSGSSVATSSPMKAVSALSGSNVVPSSPMKAVSALSCPYSPPKKSEKVQENKAGDVWSLTEYQLTIPLISSKGADRVQNASVSDLLIRIKYAIEDCKSKCSEQLSQLQAKKDDIRIPKNCEINLFLKLEADKKALSHELIELESRHIEFSTFCEHLHKNASSISGSNLEKRFHRECVRFERGLPIYSHRREILEMIRKNQVSILIAETGSGKSTQLIQYLYDADFSTNGTIVCTQPRKVAAMSLAKYVSSEMLESLGIVVGYKTGIRGKFCDQTKLLYMTDHTLLNECVADATFSKYSCLIVDEAHERSLNTDVLLAFIKRCLPHRPDLRVIITSATIDPQNFIEYFGQCCPVKRVAGRTFPVDVTYCPPIDNQSPTTKGMAKYVFEAVNLVSELHINEPGGDILVFLTSPGEVEQACQALEKYNQATAVILPLHGKLQPEEQQKVFQDYQQRKIVFSTNVAETSVTIPGMKYIVDSGVAKELCFDAKKNMNSLEVRPISKSSAEQRKGRAGRTSAGKCYRLYSEETYNGMSERMLPEILRVALAGTVLKLYELGITDVLSFDFIEKPEDVALRSAVDTLEFLGAISDGKLSDIGKIMASLPIDPRLSKIILDGLHEGVGIEAIASVSISTLAGTIFFRGGTEEMKERSDLLKSTFSHSHGDQMTHLLAYSKWMSQSHTDRNTWCVENSVNAKSMRIIRETIKDLMDILSRELHISLSAVQMSLRNAEEKLPKLFFKAFANNLCAFLGHEKIGYFNPNFPEEKFVIFPGSSLCHLNHYPPLIVYEKTLKTSQHFLLQTLPVQEDWVKEAMQSGMIKCHPTSYDRFKQLEVVQFTVSGLGAHVLLLVVKKQREIMKQATETSPQQVQFVASPEQGLLKVFVQPRFHEHLQVYLHKYIENIKEDLKKFRAETGATADEDNVRVLIGCGGSIVDVLMPNQYRTLVVKGPLVGTWPEEIEEKLTACGTIERQKLGKFKVESRLFITYRNAKDAEKAVKVVTPAGVTIKPQLSRKQDGLTVSSLSLKIEWSRRTRKNFVNIDFNTDYAATILSCLSMSNTTIGGSLVRFRPSKYNPGHIFAQNIPPHLTEKVVKDELSVSLAQLGYDAGSYQVIFSYSEKFESTPEELQSCEEELHKLVSPTVSKDRYTLNLLYPKDFHKLYIAYINFQNLDEGLNTMSALERAYIYNKPIQVCLSLSSTIRYSSSLYAAVESSLLQATSVVHADYKSVKVSDKKYGDGNVLVKITSDDLTEYVAALNKLNSVLQPHVIECVTPMLSEYMRSKRCEEESSRIETLTSTVIRRDFRMKCLKIFGTEANTTKAISEFDCCLSFVHDGTKYIEVELKKSGRPPGLFKYLITTFGLDLHLLIGKEGISMARVDLRNQLLILFATEAGHQLVSDIIDHFTQTNAQSVQQKHTSLTEVECCACYTSIDKPEDIYRLEFCGHAYHLECIESQLARNTVVVPVVCVAEGCSEPFMWKDFESLHALKKMDLRDIITESRRSYVSNNQDTVRNCPTPDCSMVYTVSGNSECFLCSHCGVIICTKCHKTFHNGLTCETNASVSNSDPSFERWLLEDRNARKRCPKCEAPIEKIDGCANVTCRQCRSHICWKCLAFFLTDQECYAHLRANHNGMYV